MISLSLLALASVMDCVPHEYVIDFGPPLPLLPFKYEMALEFWARDGTSLSVPTEIPAGDDSPEGTRDLFLSQLKRNGWVARPGPGATMTVTGTKKGSPIKPVKVKSPAAFPTVRWVPLLPQKK